MRILCTPAIAIGLAAALLSHNAAYGQQIPGEKSDPPWSGVVSNDGITPVDDKELSKSAVGSSLPRRLNENIQVVIKPKGALNLSGVAAGETIPDPVAAAAAATRRANSR